MACEVGQRLQDEFDKSVAVRVELEARMAERPILQEAKVKESSALQRRSFHIRDCQECWVRPPRLRRTVASYERMMTAS
jgi:hypothetical protein